MNSSQNKRQNYEHSYKPLTALRISGRNMECSYFCLLFWELFMVCRSVHISPSCFDSCSCFVGVFIFLSLILRVVAVWWIPKPLCPTVWFLRFMDHIWGFYFPDCTLRYISTSLKNISVHKGNIRLFHPFMEYFKTKRYIVCRSVHISPSCFDSCSCFVGVFIFLSLILRVLLQTMNSSQNKREEYEHSYKPRTTLKIRDRNMNTPTKHEQLSKQFLPLVLRVVHSL
jgi:hypothetical protein